MKNEKTRGTMLTSSALILCVITFVAGFACGSMVAEHKAVRREAAAPVSSAPAPAAPAASAASAEEQMRQHIRHLREDAQKNPDNAAVWTSLGNACFDAGDAEGAIEAYQASLRLEPGNADVRTVLRLHPALAPYKAAILPLSKKLSPKAEEIYRELRKDFMVDFDDAGSIGKRYRREDEIGTPLCVTVDFQTVGDENTPADNCVTVRDRDTMEQVRIPIAELKNYIAEKCAF